MIDSIRRIQQDGYSKPLLALANRWRTQNSCAEYIKKDNDHCFLTLFNHNGLCWYHEGIVEKSSSVLLEISKDRVIEVDTASHKLLRVNGEEVKDVESKQVLDLSDDGERWEGDVLNNEPYGWGVLYDSENQIVYEGFRIGDVNVCYGRSYYSDIQKPEYEGTICEGKRWGRGIHYDRNGTIVFVGECINEQKIEVRIELVSEHQLLHNHLEELILRDNCCNGKEWTSFDFSILTKLRVLRVKEECFRFVEEVKFVGLSQLESVVIGEGCFTMYKNGWPQTMNPNRHFYLKYCERLRELKIGRVSFSDYSLCEISNLPLLEAIEMGEWNDSSDSFMYASLELKSNCFMKE